LSGSDIARIYGAGLKSLVTFEIKKSELDFGTALFGILIFYNDSGLNVSYILRNPQIR